jgi:hypothetical protein
MCYSLIVVRYADRLLEAFGLRSHHGKKKKNEHTEGIPDFVLATNSGIKQPPTDTFSQRNQQNGKNKIKNNKTNNDGNNDNNSNSNKNNKSDDNINKTKPTPTPTQGDSGFDLRSALAAFDDE